ncbi:MAG: ATP-binding protein [Thermodesulfobacteriota bacterium]
MSSRRILLIDDDVAICEAVRSILVGSPAGDRPDAPGLGSLLSERKTRPSVAWPAFTLDTAHQGQEGLALVQKAVAEDQPYSVAFVDVRMPPGWDGVQTARRIREADPDVELVIVTAYSDHAMADIVRTVGFPERLLFLRKPFDSDEITQLALSLSEKWRLAKEVRRQQQELEERYRERQEAESVLRSIAEAVSGATGERFFGSLAASLAQALGMDFAVVAKFVESDPTRVQTVVVWADGRLGDNFAYQLAGAPCGKVVQEGLCCYPKDAWKLFPRDPLLADLGVEAYIGVRLHDSAGAALGLVAVMDRKEAIDTALACSMLRIFGARAAAELERLQQEKKLQHAGKLESVGRLAAGMAHEINNPLNNASLAVQTAQRRLAAGCPDDFLLGKLAVIERNIEKASGIVQQLLQFSRQGDPKFRQLDINEVVRNALDLVGFELKEIEVIQSLTSPAPVFGDPAQLEQVMVNLLINAGEAIRGRGLVAITTACEGEEVIVRIRDSGCGIQEGSVAKVFEPFFTTKEVGKGTGLGLAICYGIINRHDGQIEIASVPDEGTTVTIRLPAARAAI